MKEEMSTLTCCRQLKFQGTGIILVGFFAILSMILTRVSRPTRLFEQGNPTDLLPRYQKLWISLPQEDINSTGTITNATAIRLFFNQLFLFGFEIVLSNNAFFL